MGISPLAGHCWSSTDAFSPLVAWVPLFSTVKASQQERVSTSQDSGTISEERAEIMKELEDERSIFKRLASPTCLLHTWTHKMKRVNIQMLEERRSQTLPPAVELLTFDGCWGRQSHLNLEVGAPGRLPVTQRTTSHTCAYGKHKLELVVNIVKGREIGREACRKHLCTNRESSLRLWWETHITFWETSEQVSRESESVTSTAGSYKRNQILSPHPLVSAYTPPYCRWHVLTHTALP